MEEFQDFDSEGFDISTCLFDVPERKTCEMKAEKNFQPSSAYKDPGEHFERVEFFDSRETPYIPINLPTF